LRGVLGQGATSLFEIRGERSLRERVLVSHKEKSQEEIYEQKGFN